MIAKPHMHAHEAITEAFNLSMLQIMTTIPVPEVQQVVVNASSYTYPVMEYIDGQTLAGIVLLRLLKQQPNSSRSNFNHVDQLNNKLRIASSCISHTNAKAETWLTVATCHQFIKDQVKSYIMSSVSISRQRVSHVVESGLQHKLLISQK